MKVRHQRMTSFMIVDTRFVAIEITGVDREGLKFPAGLLVLEDRAADQGRLATRLTSYFDNVVAEARPLTDVDLVPPESTLAQPAPAHRTAVC